MLFNKNYLPKKLNFSFCTNKPVISVNWDDQTLYYYNDCSFFNIYFDSNSNIKSGCPDKNSWLEFWDKINQLQVWNWKAEYKFRGVKLADNSQWRLIIVYQGKEIKSSGSNSFPPHNLNQPSDKFIELIDSFIALGNSI